MTRTVLLALALLLPLPLVAQSVRVQSYDIGTTRYHSGAVSAPSATAPLSGSSYRIGTQTYTTLQLGTERVTGTAYTIGTQDYSSWSNGTTTTGYRIGTQYYTQTSDGRSYTTYSVGTNTYTTGTDGTSLTTYRIGSRGDHVRRGGDLCPAAATKKRTTTCSPCFSALPRSSRQSSARATQPLIRMPRIAPRVMTGPVTIRTVKATTRWR